MFLTLGDEESVGLISAVHSHRYYAKKIDFYESAHNSHQIDIFIIATFDAMQLIWEG